jgi:hypothetical protein
MSGNPAGPPRARLQTTRFQWITNFVITRQNASKLANQGGRLRWTIENEGFNDQKHGGHALEHPYRRHPTAGKVFYLLLQIAHLIFQLIETGSLFRSAFPAGVGSARNLAQRLLEAWRNLRLGAEDLRAVLTARVWLRFDTSWRPPVCQRVATSKTERRPCHSWEHPVTHTCPVSSAGSVDRSRLRPALIAGRRRSVATTADRGS